MEEFYRQTIPPGKIPARVVHKWSPSALSEGFVPFPKKLLRSLHKIFPNDKSMKQLSALLAVVDFKRPDLERFPSMKYLSFTAGLTEQEFTEALNLLKANGLLTVSGDSEGMQIEINGLLDAVERSTTDQK